MPSSAELPLKVPPTWVLILRASSADLGLSILLPIVTIFRDDFSASADRPKPVQRPYAVGCYQPINQRVTL